MSSQSEEEEWESWEEEYSYMSSDIYQSIKKNSHLLDINDGHHAKWHEDQLGIMIVLPLSMLWLFLLRL